jgi:uncharacterized protein (TIGR02302 family)
MRWKSDQPETSVGSASVSLARQLDGKVRRARLVLVLDRLWPALWLPGGVIGVFLLVSLFGLWPRLPFEIHQGMLWAFGIALVLSLAPLVRIKWPDRAEALRRLEAAAGLPHRPATSYHDTLAGQAQSPATTRIWTAHRERMSRLFSRLKAGWPYPRVDRRDPYALRALLLLLLAIGYVANLDDAGDRIRSAFVLKANALPSSARLDAWITPPLYTGKPPIMVADGSRQKTDGEQPPTQFTVPEQSELTVRVNHADAAQFSLRIVPAIAGDQPPPTENADRLITAGIAKGKENTAEFKEKLTAAAEVELLDNGVRVARWSVDIIEDAPPVITLTEAPAEAQRGSLRFKYSVQDDYGVLSAQAIIARAADEDDDEDSARPAHVQRLGQAPSIPLTLPRANTKQGDGQTYRDLASHYWAGLPAAVTLEARDQAEQIGRSEPHKLILPERKFEKPLAKALIEQRKKLVDRPDLKAKVARALDGLTIAPELFIRNTQVYLGIRTAFRRLTNSDDTAAMESTADLLWQVAVHIEDGDLSDAERRLRTAQEELMKALERDASEEEIKRLMDELRTALNEFLENMKRQAQRNPNFAPENPLSQNRTITSQDLERMLKKIEDLAKTGSKDAARQMLSELRDLLENAQSGNQASNSQSQEMMQMLDGLSELITKQQQLLDETFRAQQESEYGSPSEEGEAGDEARDGREGREGKQGRQGQGQGKNGQGKAGQGKSGQGKNGQNPFPGLGEQQGGLQKQLKELMDRLKGFGAKPPEQFDGAGQAMGKAGDALGQENAGRATEQQTLALDKMRQGAKSLVEQMMSGMGQPGKQGRGQAGAGDRDPLGRPLPTQGLDNGDSVKVPEEGDIQRARQILEELRRRLGERARPPGELDYIERLIERF